MRYEPSINYEQLAQAIFHAYQIKATNFTFIPVGFAAVCYRLQSHHRDYFLKLWPRRAQDDAHHRQRTHTLRLARALYERNIYPHIAYPLLTSTGTLTAPYGDGDFALFPFLDGSPLPAVWPTVLQNQWVQALICIHRATPQLADVLPAREQFTLPFVTTLRQSFVQLAQLDPAARVGLCTARDRLLAVQHDIEAQIARLTTLQHIVRQLPSPFVLCHTDMGSDNLLLGEDGQLYVLDWDEATVAPPEHDLHEARWIAFDHLVHTYRAGGGAAPLYLEHFAFYILRRALGDMTVRLARLITTNTTDVEDADALHGIEAWGIRQWEALDATLATIKPALC